MTHVCFTPPQPVLHGDCTPNLSPPPAGAGLRLSHCLGESAGTAGMWVAQPQGHQNRPFGGELLPLHPYSCRDRQQDTVSCASQGWRIGPWGRTATQTAAERSHGRYLSSAGSSCSARPTAWERSREVSEVGARASIGKGWLSTALSTASQRSSWGQAIPAGLPGSVMR